MIALIIAILGLAFFYIFLAFKLNEEHGILQLLLVFCTFALILLIPKATLDTECYPVVNQSIETYSNVTNSTTTVNTYTSFCPETVSTGKTNLIFYTTILWIIRMFWIYVAVFFIYKVLMHYGIIAIKPKRK